MTRTILIIMNLMILNIKIQLKHEKNDIKSQIFNKLTQTTNFTESFVSQTA